MRASGTASLPVSGLGGLKLVKVERAVLVDVRPLEAALQLLICERVGAQILSLGAAFGGLAGGFEAAGAAA